MGFNLKDGILFVREVIKYRLNNRNITVKTWLESVPFSQGATRVLEILCILMCDRTDNTNIQNFMGH